MRPPGPIHPRASTSCFCPPWAYLDRFASALRGVGVRFGVQTTAVESAGAFTGEHAAEMARDLGAEFAIVGHSERRRLYAETDAVVVEKYLAARRAGLTPIVCVGETLEERRSGNARRRRTRTTRRHRRRRRTDCVGRRRDRLRTGMGNRDRRNRHPGPSPGNARPSSGSTWRAGVRRSLREPVFSTAAASKGQTPMISSRRPTSTAAWLAEHRWTPGSSRGFAGPRYANRRGVPRALAGALSSPALGSRPTVVAGDRRYRPVLSYAVHNGTDRSPTPVVVCGPPPTHLARRDHGISA